MSSALLVQLLIAASVGLPAFLGGMFARRKSAADVEVTLSAEARQWASSFAEGARTATDAARNAMDQAREAAVRAKDCQARCDAMERHIGRLEGLLREHSITPPPPPWAGGASGG